MAETIRKAFYIAKTGKPGVVVVDLPKDVQRAYGSDIYQKEITVRGYKPNTSVHTGQIHKALNILKLVCWEYRHSRELCSQFGNE